MPLNKQALNIQLMFVSINKMIYVSRRKSQSWHTHPPPIFQECCCYWDDGGIGESPNGSMVTTPISPVRIYCACGRSAVSGGEGGGTLTGMWIAVNQRTIEGNKETRKKWLDWEKKKLHSVLSVLVCVFIYIFFLFEHFFNTRIRKSTRQ